MPTGVGSNIHFHDKPGSAFSGVPSFKTRYVGRTGPGVWATDGHGHGTHCAGTIGSVGDNNVGVVGIRKDPNLFRFHVGKGLSNEGFGYESDILAAVWGCVDRGSRVISMSLEGAESSETADEFYRDMYTNHGVLIVAAAGNEGDTGGLHFPAAYPAVVSVAAVDENEVRPGFSQCNEQVEITAPGVDVLSTYANAQYKLSCLVSFPRMYQYTDSERLAPISQTHRRT